MFVVTLALILTFSPGEGTGCHVLRNLEDDGTGAGNQWVVKALRAVKGF
jgi:hypothetical protein